MKQIIISLITLLAVSANANQTLELEMTGFKIINESTVLMKLQFRDELVITISKNKFNSQAKAAQFCNKQFSSLDNNFSALLFAMSGAANANQFLKSTISFSINETSGIWAWSGKDNKVTLMYNGKGTFSEEKNVQELNQITSVELPAICVHNIQND